MRRLDEHELAHFPAVPVSGASQHEPARLRAVAVVDLLRPFMREVLALEPAQVEDLARALERALLLYARSEP